MLKVVGSRIAVMQLACYLNQLDSLIGYHTITNVAKNTSSISLTLVVPSLRDLLLNSRQDEDDAPQLHRLAQHVTETITEYRNLTNRKSTLWLIK